MKKKVLAVLLAGAMVFAMAGCGSSSGGEITSNGDTSKESNETADATGESKEIAFVCPICAGDPNWNSAMAGMEKACEETGYTVNMVGPAQLDAEQWVKDMDTAISTGYDMIITTGAMDVIRPGVDKAIESDIPVCLIDTDIPDSDRFSYIGLDNYELGCALADMVADITDGEAGVCLMGMDMTQTVFLDRIEGFEETIAEKYPDIEVVTVQSAADAVAAADVTGQVINGFQEVNCFVGMDGTVPKGIAQTLTEKEATEDYTSIALSVDQQILDYIRSGGLDGGVGLDFYTMGYQAVLNCQAYANGGEYEEVTIPASVPVLPDGADDYAASVGLN